MRSLVSQPFADLAPNPRWLLVKMLCSLRDDVACYDVLLDLAAVVQCSARRACACDSVVPFYVFCIFVSGLIFLVLG